MIEVRWVEKDTEPPFGAVQVPTLSVLQKPVFNVLQYRERENPLEIGLQDAIWSEWKNT